MGTFAGGMAALIDEPVRYDLAESTGPALGLGELMTPEVARRLGELSLGYGNTRGDDEARRLVAADVGIDETAVLLTAGASAAMFLVALAALEPGARAVCATPCFPPARTVPEALRAEVVGVPLSFDRGYRLDVDALAGALTPDTRLVSLASPQNPSGVRIAEPELRALLGEVGRRAPEAVVLFDETYRHTWFGEGPPKSMAALSPQVVTCASLSKSHGAPGLRAGWLTATDPALLERLRLAKFNTLICSTTPDELLATEVLRRGEQILAVRHQVLTSALATLTAWASRHVEAIEFLAPDGGAICCLRLRAEVFDDAAVARFYAALPERDVRVAPGSWFGESDRVFRLGFGHLPADLFPPALDRLAEALHSVMLAGSR
jgi:aspartate/methionine/tyrosine aminotransferase